MITHYLKISIRNLMKYNMHSFISIFGRHIYTDYQKRIRTESI